MYLYRDTKYERETKQTPKSSVLLDLRADPWWRRQTNMLLLDICFVSRFSLWVPARHGPRKSLLYVQPTMHCLLGSQQLRWPSTTESKTIGD